MVRVPSKAIANRNGWQLQPDTISQNSKQGFLAFSLRHGTTATLQQR